VIKSRRIALMGVGSTSRAVALSGWLGSLVVFRPVLLFMLTVRRSLEFRL